MAGKQGAFEAAINAASTATKFSYTTYTSAVEIMANGRQFKLLKNI